jgi:hypothetical protein
MTPKTVNGFFILSAVMSHNTIYPSTEALAAILSFFMNFIEVTGALCMFLAEAIWTCV